MNNFVRRVKNLTTKQKIYIFIFLILFFLQYFVGFGGAYKTTGIFERNFEYANWTNKTYIGLVSIFGLITAFIRRRKSMRAIKGKSLLSIISNDYSLSSYASLSILSIIYTCFQGLFLGAGLGFIFFALGGVFDAASFGIDVSVFTSNFAYFFVCVFLTVVTRVIVEGTSLIFRAAEDFSKLVNR